ncbi:MAG: metallophosphoesterase [Ignavibacteriales bacterium]|nr:metallophosphoesterase [Ignavibacteriales bacterium]
MPLLHQFVLVFFFLSDSQQPLWFETLRLPRDHNEEATHSLFSAIAQDTTATAVFHLGDMVSAGSSTDDWDLLEQQIAPLRRKSIPFYPTYGNHEYFWHPAVAMPKYLRHFAAYASGWYVVRTGNAAVVMLNSNFYRLTGEEWDTQCRWYRDQLARLDKDSSIAVVVVATHFPPYTNSAIVDPSGDVLRDFVPPYLASQKARLFLSGHAHAFEHFRQGGKDFLVIGGGGGLLHPLLCGEEERTPDLYPAGRLPESFHYLTCTISDDSLIAQPVMLGTDRTQFFTPYRLALPIR